MHDPTCTTEAWVTSTGYLTSISCCHLNKQYARTQLRHAWHQLILKPAAAAALEGKASAAEAVEKGLGHRSSVEDLRSIITTSLTARRWQSKTVSKALPALAPFVPRMLRDDLLTSNPKCLSGAAPHNPQTEQTLEDDSKSSNRIAADLLHTVVCLQLLVSACDC